ncbi:hypothetical protein [Ornithinibacillus gellani]|uniref:hypothetical protein n=1 Tax=Ornithinibacillus gellani TaxID=2293253 RepID=UPI001680DC9C|nr:hypothetical protein [Ornithinibacillus gellani]
MKQFLYGLALFIFLVLPPVANLMESIMIIHMHMQMPMLIAAGFLMAKYFQHRFPSFFQKWNPDGVPGILLFLVVFGYWMIPRTMDEALTFQAMEWFKFISLTFLAGVPLRDSWKKLSKSFKYAIFMFFAILFVAMGWLYIAVPVQLCNNYLLVDQLTLGWGFLTMAICIIIYLIYITFTDQSEYESE